MLHPSVLAIRGSKGRSALSGQGNLAKELKIIGLMNIQFAVKEEVVYVIEVNPRASRTIPFVSKAIGKPLAKACHKGNGR